MRLPLVKSPGGATRTAPAVLADVPLGGAAVLTHHPSLRGAALRLAELGLRAGERVVVLHRTAGDGRVVGVGHTRIALDHRITALLRVELETP